MFTGIVEATSRIRAVDENADGRRLRLEDGGLGPFEHGQSISVSGVCLTVEESGDGWFTVFTASETLEKTTLDALGADDAVNVERAMPADGRLDGHIVQGHVDTTTAVAAVEQVGEDWTFTFELPAGYERFIAPKGSIALDGISLTVAGVDDDAGTFDVAIIPTTYAETTLSERDTGERVNVEIDVVAKYVDRLDAY